MSKSIARQNAEKVIIDKIQNIFDNAKHIQQFHFEIEGSVATTKITYEVTEVLFFDEKESE